MNHIRKVLRVSLQQKKHIQVNFCSSPALFNTSTNEVPKIENTTQTSEVSPVLHRTLQFCPTNLTPRQIWIENFDEIKEKKRGLVELHPKIFGTMPRLDLIHQNVKWQQMYQKVVLFSAKITPEMPGGGRKPWPQKHTGKARQGSIRAPQFIRGGTCHGPRNPTSYFYMLPWHVRVHGLTSTLSAKFAQDDLHVVDNLHIPVDDSQYILDLVKERNWGPSALLVDVDDIMPRNITVATSSIGHVNLMPVYGLNVFGMLKHDTLVLTLAAVEQIEKRIITLLNSANAYELGKELK